MFKLGKKHSGHYIKCSSYKDTHYTKNAVSNTNEYEFREKHSKYNKYTQ